MAICKHNQPAIKCQRCRMEIELHDAREEIARMKPVVEAAKAWEWSQYNSYPRDGELYKLGHAVRNLAAKVGDR